MSSLTDITNKEKIKRCSIPGCPNKSTNPNLIFHKFSQNEYTRSMWFDVCNINRNGKVGGKYVCSNHFSQDDYFINKQTLGEKSKKLKYIAVPSLNLQVDHPSGLIKHTPTILKRDHNKKESFEPVVLKASFCSKSNNMISEYELPSESHHSDGPDEIDSLLQKCFDCQEHSADAIGTNLDTTAAECSTPEKSMDSSTQTDTMENNSDLDELPDNCKKMISKCTQSEKLNLMTLIKTDDDLIAFTGINFQILEALTKAVVTCEDIQYSHSFKNSVRDRIVLCLCKLKLNLSFNCLAVLFSMTRQTAVNNFEYMIHFLAFILKDLIYWPADEEISRSMPECFSKYNNTKVVLDCTEIPIQKPSCLRCRLRLYSHYKGCETIKLLLGITPSGLICYLSEAFGGRASDKGLFRRCKILDRVTPTRDAIMVDKGFDIESECAQNHVQLIMPPKLQKKKQFSKFEADSNASIASARVHIERSIQRFKIFSILSGKFKWKMIHLIDDICIVVAASVNLQKPILADDKFSRKSE